MHIPSTSSHHPADSSRRELLHRGLAAALMMSATSLWEGLGEV